MPHGLFLLIGLFLKHFSYQKVLSAFNKCNEIIIRPVDDVTRSKHVAVLNTGWLKKMDSISYVYISWTIHGMWMIYIMFERGGPKFSNTTARALAWRTVVQQRQLRAKWLLCSHVSRSPDTRGRPELSPLHRQPICSNWWFQRQMLFLVGGWMLEQRRNARRTAVADSVLMNSRTQKILCCIAAILLSTDAAARLCARRAL